MLCLSAFAIFLCIVSSAVARERADIIVAKDGSGDFTTIQAAIDAIPKNNDALKIILIKNNRHTTRPSFAPTRFIIGASTKSRMKKSLQARCGSFALVNRLRLKSQAKICKPSKDGYSSIEL
jgi:hypothetical protein